MKQLAYNRIQAWKRCMTLTQHCCTAADVTVAHLKSTHAVLITHGLHVNNFAVSKLLVAFCDGGVLLLRRHASIMFDQTPSPNAFMYNTLIRAHVAGAEPHLALRYFCRMVKGTELVPDKYTFHFVILACVKCCLVGPGKQVHCVVVKNGLAVADRRIRTGLVRLYGEGKDLRDARKVFDEIPDRDVVLWNVMMNGYVKCGLASEGLRAFGEMLAGGIEADEFCVATALAACADLGDLGKGKWVHEYVKRRRELDSDVFVASALVDMYGKCGCIDLAVEVFEGMLKRNKVSWSSMIGAFGVHGCAMEAISCLGRMQVEDGIRPDGVVLLGVLTACTHVGMVEKGKVLLDNMEARFGVVPKQEHYSCVIDLLCKAGRLSEAFDLIRKMPMKPLASAWGALLSGCRVHNNVDLAEITVEQLLQLANDDRGEIDGAYVQLSNIYLGARRSEDALRIRKMIGERGCKKTPGCSMIEVDGKVNEFVSGDVSNSHCAQICTILDLISADSTQDHL